MRRKDGGLAFSEQDRIRVWKHHMEEIMNVENVWDERTEVEVVEGPIEKVTCEEVVESMNVTASGKAPGPSEVSIEMIRASGKVGIDVMMKLCQRVMDGEGMPDEWKTSVIVPIYKGKGDALNCGSYRGVKLLEHGMKVVERVLDRRIRDVVEVDNMQFGFMPGRGTTRMLCLL